MLHPKHSAEGTHGSRDKPDGPVEMRQKADLRDYLAGERTFLAWIRTGLALMGFGFVVARFGLFLQQVQVIEHEPMAPSHGLSLWFGCGLIAIGVIMNLYSSWHHARLVRQLDKGDLTHSRPSAPPILIALLLALVGLAMAIYLVSVGGSVYAHQAGKGVWERSCCSPPRGRGASQLNRPIP